MKPLRAVLGLVGLAALAGCEFPTEAPILDQRWILPVDNTTISVNELLPAGVSASGSSFSVRVDPFSTSRTLGDLCTACQPLQGQAAPVPGFEGTFSLSQTLPADVVEAALTSGSVAVAIQNGFSFDPLAGGGKLTITLTDGPGGRQVGRTEYSGALPPGASANPTLALAAGTVGSTLQVSVVVTSPGGQTTTIDNAQRLTVNATPGALQVGSARVNVAGRRVNFAPVDLDVEDIDDSLADRIQAGSIVLDITNPFGVGVGATVDITHPGGRITKPLGIGGGATSSATLSYTGEEMRAFMGEPNVRLTGGGTVASGAGAIRVTPGQQVLIKAKLDLTLRIGD